MLVYSHFFFLTLWCTIFELAAGLSAEVFISRRRNTKALGLSRRANTAIGIGDAADSLYSARFQVGTTIVNLVLATAQFSYGDPQNLTFASGPIVSGSVQLSEFLVQNQFIVAANATTTPLPSEGISGVFGLGFPFGNASQITNQLVQRMIPANTSPNGVTDLLLSILPLEGPMLPRLALSGQLDEPVFTMTLQRTTVELGGNVGQLTIGKLPGNLSDSSLTYVPVRLYSPDEGGIPGPSSNPSETYPLNWEVPLDAVFLNGHELPPPSNSLGIYTALIDSGSSSLAGPEDVVSFIYNVIASKGSSNDDVPEIDCNTPVNLTFVFGGRSFPVDSRDFLGFQDSIDVCSASSLKVAPAPTQGRLVSWILGAPFFRSNLIAFRYGDLMQPSLDAPRIGFLSTVPENVDEAYASDIASASQVGQFFATTIPAPTATFAATTTDSVGVGQAPTVGPEITGAIPNIASDDSGPNGEPNPGVSQKNNNGAPKLASLQIIFLSLLMSMGLFRI